VIVDWHAELPEWVEILGKVHKRRIQIFAYANNHYAALYAGHAPATIEMYRSLWDAARRPDRSPTSIAVSGNLFEWNIKDALKFRRRILRQGDC